MKKLLIISLCFLLAACAHPGSKRTASMALRPVNNQTVQQCDVAVSKAAADMRATKSIHKHSNRSVLMKSEILLKEARTARAEQHYPQCVHLAKEALRFETRAEHYLKWRQSVGV